MAPRLAAHIQTREPLQNASGQPAEILPFLQIRIGRDDPQEARRLAVCPLDGQPPFSVLQDRGPARPHVSLQRIDQILEAEHGHSFLPEVAQAAAQRGDHATIFLFDEGNSTFLERSAGLGIDVEPWVRAGRVALRQVDPVELTPGEFAHTVRHEVEGKPGGIVVIDSLNGYLNAMPSERFLTLHLHELLAFLGQRGVTTILLMTQHGVVGGEIQVPVDASYLADTVILLRYFEALGEVRQAISVIKKRTGRHERTIRELRFGKGIEIGEPLRQFQGVLGGAPQFLGTLEELIPRGDGSRRS